MDLLTFQSPQWRLLPDPVGVRRYANVDNRMEVKLTSDPAFRVAVAVPTGLFTLMKDVFKVPVGETVTLAIDQDDFKDRYVFSLMYGGDNLYDLWMYTGSTLPQWILNPQYRC